MAYEQELVKRATAKLYGRKDRREWELEQRKKQVRKQIPEVFDIDRKLSQTMVKLSRATFGGVDDVEGEVARIRDENLALQARRKELLESVGMDENALDYQPFCPDCGDKGWKDAHMCHCLKELCAKEQIADLSKMLDLGDQSFDAFRLDYYPEVDPNGGPPPRQIMTTVYQVCRQFAETFGEEHPESDENGELIFDNLYLYGNPGLGKTFLSACIARVVSEKGYSVVYDTAGNVFGAFENKKFNKDASTVQESREDVNRYMRCDLLILDDLGTEMLSPVVRESMYSLINTRMVEHRHTVISSNLRPDELPERYTPATISRIEGTFRALPFMGNDIRPIKLNS